MNFSSCLQQNVRSKTVAVVGERNPLRLTGFSMWHPRRCGRSQTSADYRKNIFPAMKAHCVLVWS